ncbi:DUF3800 domain-containing protein [Deinococcus taklimakanensis]|uniref:DUF3800 domain-containing protein n=1 Tax=Deinococcus taklimakanensis TaxID=536443 RepID=A0ABW5P308_9DEIO
MQLTIFADESYNKKHYVLGGFIAEGQQIEKLEGPWRALQEEMKEVLLREYPLSRDALKGEALPELKANALFKSAGFYRHNTSGKKHYWEQQWEWLERAYGISTRCGARAFALRLPPDESPQPLLGDVLLSELFAIADHPTPTSVKEAMNRIELDRHAAIVAMSLCAFGALLEHEKNFANVIWDEHALGQVIGSLRSPAMLRQRGVFGYLLDHSFADSRRVPMLQAADIRAYFARASSEADDGDPPQHYDVLDGIMTRHPCPHVAFPPVDFWQMSLSRLPLVEMVFRGSGGPKAYQQIREASLPDLLEFIFAELENAAVVMERQADLEAARERSVLSRVRKLFSGRGARTSTTD